MKKFLGLLALLTSSIVSADPLQNCLTIMNATSQSSSTTGSIVAFDARKVSAMSIVGTANNVSGTTPTLDVAIDSCRTSTGGCVPWASLSQCASGSCWNSGLIATDVNNTNVNWFKFFRVRTTLGGTSPVYNVRVELCYAS